VNIRLFHRNTGSNYVLYEFYPRRLVQSDDIQAESILAINIAADAITAEKILAGTITGDRISSATTITAGSGNAIAVLNGASGILTDGTSQLTDADGTPIRGNTWRIYAGNADPNIAPFRVEADGSLFATNATITGNITTGSTITGAVIQTSSDLGARTTIDSNGLKIIGDNLNNVSDTRSTLRFRRQGDTEGIGSIYGTIIPGQTPEKQLMIVGGGNVNITSSGIVGDIYIEASPAGGIVLINPIFGAFTGIGTSSPGYILDVGGDTNISSGSVYRVNGTNVVGSRITGWGAPTGTSSRGAFDTGIVTLSALAQRVKALIDDLTTHGLIGPTPP
jgi:hypothetical protein